MKKHKSFAFRNLLQGRQQGELYPEAQETSNIPMQGSDEAIAIPQPEPEAGYPTHTYRYNVRPIGERVLRQCRLTPEEEADVKVAEVANESNPLYIPRPYGEVRRILMLSAVDLMRRKHEEPSAKNVVRAADYLIDCFNDLDAMSEQDPDGLTSLIGLQGDRALSREVAGEAHISLLQAQFRLENGYTQ